MKSLILSVAAAVTLAMLVPATAEAGWGFGGVYVGGGTVQVNAGPGVYVGPGVVQVGTAAHYSPYHGAYVQPAPIVHVQTPVVAPVYYPRRRIYTARPVVYTAPVRVSRPVYYYGY